MMPLRVCVHSARINPDPIVAAPQVNVLFEFCDPGYSSCVHACATAEVRSSVEPQWQPPYCCEYPVADGDVMVLTVWDSNIGVWDSIDGLVGYAALQVDRPFITTLPFPLSLGAYGRGGEVSISIEWTLPSPSPSSPSPR